MDTNATNTPRNVLADPIISELVLSENEAMHEGLDSLVDDLLSPRSGIDWHQVPRSLRTRVMNLRRWPEGKRAPVIFRIPAAPASSHI